MKRLVRPLADRLAPRLTSFRSSTAAPTTNRNAQLVLNKAAKTGFTFWIRML